ncbi:MAG: DUF3572 domain-containing protein [Pseudomonadota bacterium]
MSDSVNDATQVIAISALSWIAADGEQISRFIALTGIEPDQMRAAASQPGFLAGVLGFLLEHEPTLMRFCEENDLSPTSVQAAYRQLSGAPPPGPGDFV